MCFWIFVVILVIIAAVLAIYVSIPLAVEQLTDSPAGMIVCDKAKELK